MTTEINQKFATYVTGIAFNLQLTKPMVVNLVEIANGTISRRATLRALHMVDTAVPTRRRLEERGLIYAPDVKWPGRYELTEAGKHVVELLRIAGLVEFIEQVEKMET